jgi:cytoskeletal protein CcmA (bactofilin family)
LQIKRDAVMNLLGPGAKFKGEVSAKGSIRIDGFLEGEGEATAELIVGKTGTVQGRLRAKDVVIGGKVEGTVIASHRVELKPGARLEGDVICRSLIIAEQVYFNGNCRMADGRPVEVTHSEEKDEEIVESQQMPTEEEERTPASA